MKHFCTRRAKDTAQRIRDEVWARQIGISPTMPQSLIERETPKARGDYVISSTRTERL